MTIAQGVNKQTRIARQAAKGTLALPAATATIMRRTASVWDLQKATFDTSAEITSTQQLKSNRHGERLINGKLDGIFTPGTYASLLSALVRRDFSAAPTTGAQTTIAAATTTGFAGTFTRSAGSYLTDGFKVGMVVRWTGWLTTGVANNNRNMIITALTATVMTVLMLTPVAIATKVAGDSVTCAAPGKVTYIADNAQTSIYHTVEEWYPDLNYSEQNGDVQVGMADVNMPGSGNAMISMTALGLTQAQTNGSGAYFTAPNAESTSSALTSATGALIVNGAQVATITAFQMKVDGKIAGGDAVVGSVTRPDVFRGKVLVTGTITAYFDASTLAGLFQNETVASAVIAITTGLTGLDDFVSFRLPQLDLNSATPDDNEVGLKRTYNFVAEYYAAGGAALADYATTLMIHDSLAA
jgi:hypothetical protein